MRDAFFCLLRSSREGWGYAAAISRGRLRVRLCGRFRRGVWIAEPGCLAMDGEVSGQGSRCLRLPVFEWTGYGHGCTEGAGCACETLRKSRCGMVHALFRAFFAGRGATYAADWKRCRPVQLRRELWTAPARDKKNGGPMMFGPPFLLSTFSVDPFRQLMLRRSGSWLGEAASMSIWSFTIWMAAAAASSPLLPRRPPQRSSACCMSLTVSTPKAMGMFH